MKNDTGMIYIDTENIPAIRQTGTLSENRAQFYPEKENGNSPSASIFVLSYNRTYKTRQCVESILKYTSGIKYRLYLMDNGSSDETLEYFKTVAYEDKVIVRISSNRYSAFALSTAMRLCESKYIVTVTNDVIVTANWLNNLLCCMESDPEIGFAVPMSSNVSNLQQAELLFSTLEEMQREAALFNKSDPSRWQERLRLINIVAIFRREVVDAVGVFDLAFFADFGEDDLSARIRRMGYKLILAGDTFIHHNHDYRNMEDKDPAAFQESLELGRKLYREKYYGLDAWDDINNFEIGLLELLSKKSSGFPHQPSILGIDVNCGTPILQIRNLLRSKNIPECLSSAYTTQAKYFYDLQCVTCGNTQCDRIEFLNEHYAAESYDIVLIGQPVNTYAEPLRVTKNVLRLVRKGGSLLLKLRNTSGLATFFHMMGLETGLDGDMPVHISVEDFERCLNLMDISSVSLAADKFQVDQTAANELDRALRSCGICPDPLASLEKLKICDYLFHIEK